MFEDIVAFLGGRVAEKLMLNDISTGASGDIERSTDIARKMVTKYGMSDVLGPIQYGSGHDEVFLGRDFTSQRNYSEEVAAEIDSEVRRIIGEAYDRCEEILKAHMDQLTRVAEFLLKHETMDGDTFRRIMAGDDIANIESDLDAHNREVEASRQKVLDALQKAEAERKSADTPAGPPPWIPPSDPSYEEYLKEHPNMKPPKDNTPSGNKKD